MTSKPCNSPQRRDRGFTLIELLIAMVILSILLAVAIPSYRDYVRRGQLSDAFSTLSDMRVKMEQHYQDNKFYGATAGSTNCPTFGSYGAFPVARQHFTLKCDAPTSQTFTLTAEGSSGMTTGYDYTINHSGMKRTANFAGATSSAVCWLTKPGTCDN
jgi:type IV pilus assembly protein PilE